DNKRPEIIEFRKVPDVVKESPYAELIESAQELDPEEALDRIRKKFASVETHSAELSLQALAVALTRVAVTLRQTENPSKTIRSKFASQCCAVLDHPLCSSRAASIMSRVPTCLGLTKDYLQKCYVVKILRQWDKDEREDSG
ncbi:hypothetical protein OESDEN_19520, partial [Oesophagostomum dentatum]